MILRNGQPASSENNKNQQHSTNLIIIEKDTSNHQLTYYFPAYVRIKIKNILNVDLASLNADILVTITMSISVIGLKQYVVSNQSKQLYEHIYEKLTSSIMMMFSRDQTLGLSKDMTDLSIRFKESDQEITFNLCKIIQFNVIPRNYLLHPFELIDLSLTLNIPSIKTQYDGSDVVLKFNCMDTDHKYVKISYNPDMINFGEYTLAKGLLQAIYYNKKTVRHYSPQQTHIRQIPQQKILKKQLNKFENTKNTQTNSHSIKEIVSESLVRIRIQQISNSQLSQKNNKIKLYNSFKQYQYCHFKLPIYRQPIVDLLTIFIPLWLLGLLNIFIFFQDNILANRIANIGGIMIAFAALIPTIRDKIPPAPHLTLVQILIYIEISTCLLAMAQSYLIQYLNLPQSSINQSSGNQDTSNSQDTSVYLWRADALYWVTVVINILIFLLVIIMFFIFYCFRKPKFDKIDFQEDQQQFNSDDKTKWKQNRCDIEFYVYQQQSKHKQFYFLKNHKQIRYYE